MCLADIEQCFSRNQNFLIGFDKSLLNKRPSEILLKIWTPFISLGVVEKRIFERKVYGRTDARTYRGTVVRTTVHDAMTKYPR